MREVIYEGEWRELATHDQWKVTDARVYNKAAEYEAIVLSGNRATVRKPAASRD